ncbi:MAG: manganese efflux pump MntP family protein [Bacteroidales bacterium]|jgi:putative Mn2+ efflux pump MntP|nr:manganese efflux pump MntP family protein [Bacteroidales bacterium]
MGLFSILSIATGLSIDSLTVSMASVSTCKEKKTGQFIRFALILGLVQAFFLILGWAAGLGLEKYFKTYDHWIAFILLSFIGGKMIYEGFTNKDEDQKKEINFNNLFLITCLGIATSIDALAIGVTLPLINLNIWLSALITLLVTFTFSLIGLFSGNFIKNKFKNIPIEVIGGLFLLGIGVKVFIEHLVNGC